MMSFKRALSIVTKKNPDRHFTGKAFVYDGAYYIEMVPQGNTGAGIDSMFKVDGTKATVTNYNPIMDGVIKPWEMKPIRTH